MLACLLCQRTNCYICDNYTPTFYHTSCIKLTTVEAVTQNATYNALLLWSCSYKAAVASVSQLLYMTRRVWHTILHTVNLVTLLISIELTLEHKSAELQTAERLRSLTAVQNNKTQNTDKPWRELDWKLIVVGNSAKLKTKHGNNVHK